MGEFIWVPSATAIGIPHKFSTLYATLNRNPPGKRDDRLSLRRQIEKTCQYASPTTLNLTLNRIESADQHSINTRQSAGQLGKHFIRANGSCCAAALFNYLKTTTYHFLYA